MTNTQHTPGPWATDGREAGWAIVGLANERIATVWRDGPGQPANARLIAAAPELLAALIDAESAMFHVRADGGFATSADRQAMDDAWAAVRAAIAKATGK